MMTAEEIKKYQLAHPDEMKQVFTDGQIQRDRLGLIPMLNDGSELANAAPAGWTVNKNFMFLREIGIRKFTTSV